jgi:hypothetical protein
MTKLPLLITDSLPLAVAFDNGRIALPALAPVLGIPGPPFLGAIPGNLPVFGVLSDFPAVIVGAPSPLAVRLAANGLLRLILRWLKNPLTIATTPFDHTGVVALKGQAKNLETFVEWVLLPADGTVNHKTGGNAAVLFRC